MTSPGTVWRSGCGGLGRTQAIHLIVGIGYRATAVATIDDLNHVTVVFSAALVITIGQIKKSGRNRGGRVQPGRLQAVVESIGPVDRIPAGHGTVDAAGQQARSTIIDACTAMAEERTGLDLATIQKKLLDKGIALRSLSSYRADIERLRDLTNLTIEWLRDLPKSSLAAKPFTWKGE